MIKILDGIQRQDDHNDIDRLDDIWRELKGMRQPAVNIDDYFRQYKRHRLFDSWSKDPKDSTFIQTYNQEMTWSEWFDMDLTNWL